MQPDIDVDFDFRSDTPPGQDPDSRSDTLRRFHRLLWSKRLPSGQRFDLVTTTPRVYLHHTSEVGEFFMSSDSVIPTFNRERRIAQVLAQIPPAERDGFLRLSYTIGGMMIFPANRIAGKMTINGARGCSYRIKDRFDLTVECIRRHYHGGDSPLSDALARYSTFFRLFGSFQGYVEFFLLQDLVSPDYSTVNCFLPFEDFRPWPVPDSLTQYRAYRDSAEAFIRARNQRIFAEWPGSGAASGGGQ